MWLKAKETEISTGLWASWLGKDFSLRCDQALKHYMLCYISLLVSVWMGFQLHSVSKRDPNDIDCNLEVDIRLY